MKKAAFYILPDQQLKIRDLYVCRLASKAYSNKLKVYIYTSSLEENEALDTQLWTFNDISFIPHKIYNPTTNATTNPISSTPPPVLIGNCTPPDMYNDVLINLALILPKFIANFSHIIEIIPNEENYRQKAREHYKHFQQLNYEVVTHDL